MQVPLLELFGHKSVTRNHLIADLLHRVGYIEKIDTGIQRIKDAVATTKNIRVEFEINEHWFTTIFYRDMNPISSDIGSDISSDVRGNSILELLLQDSSLSAQKLASILKISPRSVEKQLAKLKQDNKISRQGSKKYGTWLVNLKKYNGASHT